MSDICKKRVPGGVHVSAGYVPPGRSAADWVSVWVSVWVSGWVSGWVPGWVSRAKDAPVNTEVSLKWLPSDRGQGLPGWAVFTRPLSPRPPASSAHEASPQLFTHLDKVCRAKELQLTCLRHGNASVANVC